MRPGTVVYFPEGIHYGPQVRREGLSTLTLQYGGASGWGYMSQAQRKKGFQELSARGSFEKGSFTWLDGNGRRHRQDAFEAIWEHMMGRKIAYPEPRYSDLVVMESEAYAWMADPRSPGVAHKWLASFTERGVGVGFLRLEEGAAATIGGLRDATDLLFLMTGGVRHDGRDHPPKTAFRCQPGDAAATVEATQPCLFYRLRLPCFEADEQGSSLRNVAA
jgi:hypothetical protein